MYRTAQTILIFWMVSISGAVAADTNSVLIRIIEIRSLTSALAAQKIPVCVTGVVTVVEPRWWGQFIMQDSSGGVFVDNSHNPPPAPGDLVKVIGVSDPGGFTPCIESPSWQKLGTASLPKAEPVSIQRFMSGVDDGNRVEISGVVRAAKTEGMRMDLDLEAGGHVFQALPSFTSAIDPNILLGATLLLRGTEGTVYDSEKKRLANVTIFIPQESDFIVEQLPGKISEVATSNVLTTADDVLSLKSSEAALRIPVSITGVVTVAEPNWGGEFFVQDSTAGIFVINTNLPQPMVGDVVQVAGTSFPGGYAPCIGTPHWKKLGTATLPEARPVFVGRFMSGAEDGQRIELSGIVRSAHQSQIEKTRIRLEFESGGYRIRAFLPFTTNINPESLVGSTVQIKGTASASFNGSLRDMLTEVIFIPQISDLDVTQPPDATISQQAFTPLNSIARYRRHASLDPRIRVKGTVIFQRPGQDIFLHGQTGGLQVQSGETNFFAPGEVVEAIGFPAMERFLPVLEDATLTSTPGPIQPIVPQKVSIQDVFLGRHYADLISLQGMLLDRSLRSRNTEEEIILTLKSDRYFFTVEVPTTGSFAELASIPTGSQLEVSGICLQQVSEEGKIEGVQVLPLDASGIRILQQPGWLTPRRLLVALGLLLAVLLVGTAWTVTILRKNAVLYLSVAEKVKAQKELQKAHDQLETRVQERTRELKFEMGARKEAEIQFKAVLAERRRLAQELHDTLLQGFTGIGLRLDAVTNKLPPSLAKTKEEMQDILEKSDEYLTEARQSVWQLRSSSLQAPGDFPKALQKVSERALRGTGIPLRFSTYGIVYKLAPEIEDNFLRICEEAVTNAVKHANPAEVEVTLEYSARELRLQVQDDGCGFDLDGPDGKKTGHFGLVGIRERVKSLAGNLSLSSQLGEGTEILVTVCLSPESQPG